MLGTVMRSATINLGLRYNFFGFEKTATPGFHRVFFPDAAPIQVKRMPAVPTASSDLQKDEFAKYTLKQRIEARKSLREQGVFGLFANAEVRAIEYSYFIDGTSIDLIPVTTDIEAGTEGKFPNSNAIISLSMMVRSPEFQHESDKDAEWTSLARLGIRWLWDINKSSKH